MGPVYLSSDSSSSLSSWPVPERRTMTTASQQRVNLQELSELLMQRIEMRKIEGKEGEGKTRRREATEKLKRVRKMQRETTRGKENPRKEERSIRRNPQRNLRDGSQQDL